MRRILFLIAIVSLLLPCSKRSLAAEPLFETLQQSILELQKSMRGLETQISSQNLLIQSQAVKIEALEKAVQINSAAATPTSSAASPAPGIPRRIGFSSFNPAIGVAGTVQAKLTQSREDEEGNDTVALKELELSIAQNVDPYSRLDVIIAFNDNLEAQNVDIEEAYYTRWGLPLGFTTQIGKFRAKIGKQNLLHQEQLKTADYPLVIQDFFGEEGLSSSGVRLQNPISNPWDIPLQITGEILRGNNGPSFSGISRRPLFNTHVKSYFEPTANTGLELGWTTLFGDENLSGSPEGSSNYGVQVYGADATFSWLLPKEKKLMFQNELYFQNRTSLVHPNANPWGFYSLLDYRFSKLYSTGIRFDYLQPLDVAEENAGAHQISPYIVFHQSEFAEFKLQYSRLEPAGTSTKPDNLIYLQVDFLIGEHSHPVQ